MDDLLTTQTLYSLSENEATSPGRLPDPPDNTPPDTSGGHVWRTDRKLRGSADSADESQTPFIVELRRVDDAQSGHFRPEASLIVTSFLRTGGLLQALPAEDLSSLLYMLTFLTPNGDIIPTLVELAQAMDVSERAAVYRMERLMQFRWQGKPLVISLSRPSGLHAYAVSPSLITVRHALQPADAESSGGPRLAGREAVIAHSRATYGKPRRYVEEMIAKLNNWDLPGAVPERGFDDAVSDEVRTLQTRLMLAGVSRAQADMLIAQYPLAHIRDQLEWLPLRYAKSPARFLVAAIEKNFAPPRGISQLPPSERESGSASPPTPDAQSEASKPSKP